MGKFLLPLGLFGGLAILLYVGLGLNPTQVDSPLIDKPAPAFELVQLKKPTETFSPDQMKGQVWMLNVWASWCVSCRYEHPLFMEVARANIVPLVGLNYKDQREDSIAWLNQHGDPYIVSAYDVDGRVGIDYGVYGTPETYVIDKQGIIRYKHIGPVSPKDMQDTIMPLIKELRG